MESLRQLLIRLCYCQGIGNGGRLKVLAYCLQKELTDISCWEIIEVAQIQRWSRQFLDSWDAAEARMAAGESSCLTILDVVYPALLKTIVDPPSVIFYRGDLSLLQRPALAVVGAREPPPGAGRVLQQLIPPLTAAGLVIVSGLAKGVDSLAHKQTVSSRGQTIAVLGNGLDQYYPKEMQFLQTKLGREHLLLAEYPDGTRPRKYHFPMRNRIIAGLTLGTCVIAAKQRSGSLITAQLALEAGRDVFAVPGSLLEEGMIGCLELIQDGAKCVISAADILNELNFF